MKTILLSLFALFLVSFTSNAQSINSFSVIPANPTVNDTIYVLAHVQFSSSGCALSNQNHGVNGNNIIANAHHCIGVATAICNITDTFLLGTLRSG